MISDNTCADILVRWYVNIMYIILIMKVDRKNKRAEKKNTTLQWNGRNTSAAAKHEANKTNGEKSKWKTTREPGRESTEVYGVWHLAFPHNSFVSCPDLAGRWKRTNEWPGDREVKPLVAFPTEDLQMQYAWQWGKIALMQDMIRISVIVNEGQCHFITVFDIVIMIMIMVKE